MAEDKDSEKRKNKGSPPRRLLSSSSPPPPPPPSSSSSPSLLLSLKKTRFVPDLALCHCCGQRFPSPDGGAKNHPLRAIRSKWRVALLCDACFARVRSALSCSYCFAPVSSSYSPSLVAAASAAEAAIDCVACRRRIHLACARRERRCLARLDPASFTCVDCCVIPNIRKDSILDDLAEDARSPPEKKSMTGAPSAATDAKNADTEKQEAVRAESLSRIIPDEELALRVHRAMNGSRRISQSSSSWNSGAGVLVHGKARSNAARGKEFERTAKTHCLFREIQPNLSEPNNVINDICKNGSLDMVPKGEQHGNDCKVAVTCDRHDTSANSVMVYQKRRGDSHSGIFSLQPKVPIEIVNSGCLDVVPQNVVPNGEQSSNDSKVTMTCDRHDHGANSLLVYQKRRSSSHCGAFLQRPKNAVTGIYGSGSLDVIQEVEQFSDTDKVSLSFDKHNCGSNSLLMYQKRCSSSHCGVPGLQSKSDINKIGNSCSLDLLPKGEECSNPGRITADYDSYDRYGCSTGSVVVYQKRCRPSWRVSKLQPKSATDKFGSNCSLDGIPKEEECSNANKVTASYDRHDYSASSLLVYQKRRRSSPCGLISHQSGKEAREECTAFLEEVKTSISDRFHKKYIKRNSKLMG